MSQEKFEIEVIEMYFADGDRRGNLADIAKRHGVTLSAAQAFFEQIERVCVGFKTMPQHQASQIALNKISAFANEAAEQKSWSFFKFFTTPLYSGAVAIVVLAFGLFLWQKNRVLVDTVTVAGNVPQLSTAPTTGNDTKTSQAYHQVITRLLKTPLDKDSYEPLGKIQAPQMGYLTSGVTNVSLGQATGRDNDFIDDAVMDRIEHNVADADALKMLFFRARKLEKLGHYQDALHDYLLIAENTQQFEHELAVHISIANCYLQLGDKSTALLVLESYRQSYGPTSELDLRIDQLKSVTF